MNGETSIQGSTVSGISSVHNLIRIALLLVSMCGGLVFAGSVQAAHCHQASEVASPVSQHVVSQPVAMRNTDANIMVSMAATDAGAAIKEDCCSPDCNSCPAALCAGGHAAPLPMMVSLLNAGATEQIRFGSSLYSLLPASLPYKPPMAA